MLIFHVTSRDDWHNAVASGAYALSTRGKTLAEVGFIHCSKADQVTRVADLIYKGVGGLVLLVIDRSRVHAPVRDEPADGGESDRFPHIYGPLNLDAVAEVLPFAPNADGSFSLPEGLRG